VDATRLGWGLYLCVHVVLLRVLLVNRTVWQTSNVQCDISWWYDRSTPMLKIPLDSPWKELSELSPSMSAIVLRTRIPFTKHWLISLLCEGLILVVFVCFLCGCTKISVSQAWALGSKGSSNSLHKQMQENFINKLAKHVTSGGVTFEVSSPNFFYFIYYP
jgi:hypothetical protein